MTDLLKKLNFCQSCQIMDSRDASASKNANNLPKMLQHRKNKEKSFAALTCRTQPVPARGAQQGWL